jgi:hypothetical protein
MVFAAQLTMMILVFMACAKIWRSSTCFQAASDAFGQAGGEVAVAHGEAEGPGTHGGRRIQPAG